MSNNKNWRKKSLSKEAKYPNPGRFANLRARSPYKDKVPPGDFKVKIIQRMVGLDSGHNLIQWAYFRWKKNIHAYCVYDDRNLFCTNLFRIIPYFSRTQRKADSSVKRNIKYELHPSIFIQDLKILYFEPSWGYLLWANTLIL